MKRQLFILLTPLFFLLGEEITIKGKTINQIDGAPIAGVNIIIQGTDRGAASKLDGSFEINKKSQHAILTISYPLLNNNVNHQR